MPEFDVAAYFSRKLSPAEIENKRVATDEASLKKTAELQAMRDTEQQARKVQDATWVGKFIDPSSAVGKVANLVPQFVAGVGNVIGNTVGLGLDTKTAAISSNLTEGDIYARNRVAQGIATPEDIATLTTKRNGISPAELFAKVEDSRAQARKVRNALDISYIADQTPGNELSKDIGSAYNKNVDQVTKGINQVSSGDILSGAGNVISGVGKGLGEATVSAVTSPIRVANYVANNLPQVVASLYGKPGLAAVSAFTAGYGSDYYNRAIEKYQADNNGALPSQDERNILALKAASLTAAESLGTIGTAGISNIAKGLRSPTQQAAYEAAQIAAGVKQGLGPSAKRVAAHVAKGGAEEFVTEGYQTYQEGELEGKPASGKDIFVGAFIGGLVGSSTAGGIQALHERAGASKAVAETARNTAAQIRAESTVIKDAVEKNDPSVFLDTKSKSYNPSIAVGILAEHSNLSNATPEIKAENYKKASAIIEDLHLQRKLLEAAHDTVSPNALNKFQDLLDSLKNENPTPDVVAAIKSVEKQIETLPPPDAKKAKEFKDRIAEIDTHIAESQKVFDAMSPTVEAIPVTTAAPSVEELSKTIQEAHTPSSKATEKTAEAIQSIINLSIRSTSAIKPEVALKLANNKNNSLSIDQRDYLRKLSAARQAQNLATNQGKVALQITDNNGQHQSIDSYRERVAKAISTKNDAQAILALNQLREFAVGHQSKFDAATKALPSGSQIVRLEGTPQWKVLSKDKKLTDPKAIKENAALTIVSKDLVNQIGKEAAALKATYAELKAAYNVGIPNKTPVQSNKEVPKVVPKEEAKVVPKEVKPTDMKGQNREKDANAEAKGQRQVQGNGQEQVQGQVQNQEANVTSAPVKQTKPSAPVVEASATPAPTTQSEKVRQEAEQPASVSEAPVAEATAEVKEEQPKYTHMHLKDVVPEGKKVDFFADNLVANSFTTSTGQDSPNGSVRPLASRENFLSNLTKKTIKSFLVEEPNDSQYAAIKTFAEYARKWNSVIGDNLVKKELPYRFEDFSQYLYIEEDGKTTFEENVKTAISYGVFSWIAENATRSISNGPEEINAILLRTEGIPSLLETQVLENIGSRQSLIANALGERIYSALGYKLKNNDVPSNYKGNLIAALGNHAIALMVREGLATQSKISSDLLDSMINPKSGNVSLLNENQSKALRQETFIKIAQQEDGVLPSNVMGIKEAYRGTSNVLDNLFGVEAGLKNPTIVPVVSKQKTTKNTEQLVPYKEKIIQNEQNAGVYNVHSGMYNLVKSLDADILRGILGYKEITKENTHITNVASQQAKNDAVLREIDSVFGFIEDTLINYEGGIDTPIHFEHNVQKQQRINISTNTVNPQSYKFHRSLITRPSWEHTIDFSDYEGLRNFDLRVAEGLGVKTDTKDAKAAMAEYKALVSSQEIKDAVQAIKKAILKEPFDQKAILAGVAVGGENTKSLEALHALAELDIALDNDQSQFTTRLTGEVDGVNNGAMLANIQLGGAQNTHDLTQLMNSVGLYEKGSEHSTFNNWHSAGNKDLYEKTASELNSTLQQLTRFNADSPKHIDKTTLASVGFFTGALLGPDSSITKAGRDIVKVPVLSILFGSSVSSAVDNMADNFYKGIIKTIEDTSTGKEGHKTVEEIVYNLNTFGLGIAPNISIKRLMAWVPSEIQVNSIKGAFTGTIGKAMSLAINNNFKEFLSKRRTFNQISDFTFRMYDAVREVKYFQKMNELMDSGKIPFHTEKDGTRTPYHDMPVAEIEDLEAELKSIQPIIHTPFSKASNQLNAGIAISSSSRNLGQERMYKSTLTLGTPLESSGNKPVKSITSKAYKINYAPPGVAMLPVTTHAGDSFISHTAIKGKEVLQLHDNHLSSVAQIQQAGYDLNEALYNYMTTYSAPTELREAMLRVLRGLGVMYEGGKIPKEVMTAIAERMKPYALDHESPAKTFNRMVDSAVSMSNSANLLRLDFLSNLEYLNQYAIEGGTYSVSDAQRAKSKRDYESYIKKEMALKESDKSGIVWFTNQLESLNEADTQHVVGKSSDITQVSPELDAPINDTTDKQSPFGAIGIPLAQSDKALTEMFKAKPEMTAKEVSKALLTRGLTGFNKTLVTQLLKVVPSDLKVRYVTANTAPNEVLQAPANESHGWYVDMGNGEKAIYVLGDDFKHSNLQVETLIHELVHAATARALELDGPLVGELNNLLNESKKFIKENNLSANFEHATANLSELVAWGMSNAAFQNEVLDKVEMKTKNQGIISGLKKFVTTLVNHFFGNYSGNQKIEFSSGMTVLITNVAGLFEQSAKNASNQSPINLSQAANTTASNINKLTTLELYSAFKRSNNGVSVSPKFDAHLQNVLNSVATKVFGPFGAFKESLMKDQALTEEEVYQKAVQSGKAPFASTIQASGLPMTGQEAFVMEQVEATMRQGLNIDAISTTTAYRELAELYDQVDSIVKPENFLKVKWDQATPAEQKQATDLRNFVFAVEKGADGKSNHLARFVALGLAHEQFNNILSNVNTPTKTSNKPNGSVLASIERAFLTVTNWFAEKLTGINKGQPADKQLTALVSTLIDIEAKRRRVLNEENKLVTLADTLLTSMGSEARKKVSEFVNQPYFKNHSWPTVRAVASLVSVKANYQVLNLLETIKEFTDKDSKGQYNALQGLLNEVIGRTDMKGYMYKLLRTTKRIEQGREELMVSTETAVTSSFADKGKYLTHEHNTAMSHVVLRGDMSALLGRYSMSDIEGFVNSPELLSKAIGKQEKSLSTSVLAEKYINQAKALGYYLVTNDATVPNLQLNAENIAYNASLRGTSRVSKFEVDTYAPTIDILASLYAIKYASTEHINAVKEVFAKEASRTDGGNGLEVMLRTHAALQEQSKKDNFAGQEALASKGYVPDLFNPYTDIAVASTVVEAGDPTGLSEGQKLEYRGYSKGAPLSVDKADPNQNKRHIYTLMNGGLKRWVSAAVSFTGKSAKGSSARTGNDFNVDDLGGYTQTDMQKINEVKQREINTFETIKNFDPTKVNKTYLVPKINADRKIVDWRYVMSSEVKNILLERNNQPGRLLGALAGNSFDKVKSKEQNLKVVEALHEAYKQDFALNSKDYLQVSPGAADPQLQEIYQLFSSDMKADILDVWGRNGMWVRKDMLDITFGYRKLSAASAFDVDYAHRSTVEKLVTTIAEQIWPNINVNTPTGMVTVPGKAQVRVRQTEDIWQALVRETKSNWVVKAYSTLVNNFKSNVSLLFLKGLNPVENVKYQVEAFKAVTKYRKDSKELAAVQHSLDTSTYKGTRTEAERQKAKLEGEIANNPATELINEGLLPTIVDDIDTVNNDPHSYKSRLVKKVNKVTEQINPQVLGVGKFLLVTEDTKLYKGLSFALQISDFLARYALYKHQTLKGVSHEQAVHDSSDTFINYDVPTHRTIQALNDNGFINFTKYYVRIQKVILSAAKANPGRYLALLAARHMLGNMDSVLESSFTNKGPSFSKGAFDLPSSYSGVTPIRLLLHPFTGGGTN